MNFKIHAHIELLCRACLFFADKVMLVSAIFIGPVACDSINCDATVSRCWGLEEVLIINPSSTAMPYVLAGKSLICTRDPDGFVSK